MPIYEYQCASCGTKTDKKHAFKEPMNDACPACGGELKRVFNAASIVFKGSGFYVNDSRKGSSTTTNAASTPSGASGETKSEGAAKAEPAPSAGPSSDAAA